MQPEGRHEEEDSALPLEAAAALVIGALDGLSTQWLLDPEVDIYAGADLLERLFAPTEARNTSSTTAQGG